MAGEPGAADANELTSPGRHAPLPTNAAARVPDPFCADVGAMPIKVSAVQSWVICAYPRVFLGLPQSSCADQMLGLYVAVPGRRASPSDAFRR
jgi:hypothetical protein